MNSLAPGAIAPDPELRFARADPDRPIDIPLPTKLWRTVVRRRWVIVGAVVLSLVAGLIVTLLTTPLYTASTQVEIAREGQRVTDFRGVENEVNPGDLEFYQTQYGLLRSESLAEQVARSLRLENNQNFWSAMNIDLSKNPAASGNTANARAVRTRIAAATLLDRTAIVPVRGSRLVNINVTTPDPALSARIANAWAENYIERNLARRYDATSYARRFLETRLRTLRQRLEESERQLVAYAQAQGIINLPGTTNRETGQETGERSLVADELTRLNEEFAKASADRIQAESRLRGAQGASEPALQNDAINTLRQRRAELQAEYARLMVQFAPDYPPARSVAQQVASLDRAIAREESRVGQSIQGNFAAAQAREAALRSRVDALKGGLSDYRRRSIQYNIFQREVDTNRELYNGLLQRYKEIGVAGGVGTNNVSVVDPADVPQAPSRPRLALNLLVALLAGLALGGALVWLLEQIEEGISDPGDVQRLLDVPLLGTVPNASTETPLAELEDPRSGMVEAYLAIQTNLELSTSHGAPKSISVTSTRPKEGKSITSYALAHSLARARRRVILIDGDIRSPMVHREFGLSNERGLSNFLAGSDDLSGAIMPSPQPGLSIMTAGPQPPNAADLLTGDRLRILIERLLREYDHVVVDSPPVMGLADASLIANAVEGTIYAVESRAIRTSQVRLALARLLSTNANLLGVVLTKFEAKHSNYGYGYDYGYGYGRSKKV